MKIPWAMRPAYVTSTIIGKYLFREINLPLSFSKINELVKYDILVDEGLESEDRNQMTSVNWKRTIWRLCVKNPEKEELEFRKDLLEQSREETIKHLTPSNVVVSVCASIGVMITAAVELFKDPYSACQKPRIEGLNTGRDSVWI